MAAGALTVLHLLQVWWPYLLLVYLPRLTNLATTLAFRVVKSGYDHAIPDELPYTAGEWLRQQLAEEGLERAPGMLVHSGKLGSDAYHEDTHKIALTAETYFKRDPVYWATAAHELGHARLRARHRVLSGLIAVARLPKWALTTAGLALVVGNILYGLPGVTDLGFRCLAGALVLDGLILVDEAAASAIALRRLARSAALTRRHLRAARVTLFLALATYLVHFSSHAILLAQWSRVAALTGTGLIGGVVGAPTGWRHALVVVATVLGLLYLPSRFVDAIRPWPGRAERLHPTGWDVLRALATTSIALLWKLALVFLIVELYDRSVAPIYVGSVFLAIVPALDAISVLASLPALPFMLALGRVHKGLIERHGGIELSAVFVTARAEGLAEVAAGDSDLTERLDRLAQGRRRGLGLAVDALYVPFVILYSVGWWR